MIMSMDLATAEGHANKIVEWLRPHCERIEVAGSIRRRKATCGDVDIVCIPKISTQTDLFGKETSRISEVLVALAGMIAKSKGTAKILRGGTSADSKFVVVEGAKCQLDIWFADRLTWGTRMVCRTGSMQHNTALAMLAQSLDGKWEPYNGVTMRGTLIPCPEEADVYHALGLEYIEPERRDAFGERHRGKFA